MFCLRRRARGGAGVRRLHRGPLHPRRAFARIFQTLGFMADVLGDVRLHTHLWMMFVGTANLHLGTDAEALAWCRRGLEVNGNHSLSHFQHAAASALIGHMNEAGAAVQAGLALDPNFTLRRLRVNMPSDNPTYRAGARRIYEAMRLARVPEG